MGREIRFRGDAALETYREPVFTDGALVVAAVDEVPGIEIAELVVRGGGSSHK